MPLDGFERKVLLVMGSVSLLILAVSAVAYGLGVGLGGTDAQVEEAAAGEAGATPTNPIPLPPWGEPLLFFVIPSLLGLLAGYVLPALSHRGEARA